MAGYGPILENTVVALVLAALVAAVCAAFRPRPAIVHALWLVVLVKLVVPPVVGWETLAPEPHAEAVTLYREHVEPVFRRWTSDAPPSAPPKRAAVPLAAERPPTTTLSVAHLVLWLWITGSLVVLALVVRRRIALSRLLRRDGEPSPPRWLTAACARFAGALDVAPPRIVLVAGLRAPCTGGALRPTVFWPVDATAYEPRLPSVLAHELAHVRRGDHRVAAFEAIAAVAWWWHPLFWFLRSRVRENAELAADAWALQLTGVAPRDYAETLLQFRSVGRDRCRPRGALSAGGGPPRAFARRLCAIVAGTGPARLSLGVRLLATGVLLALLPGLGLRATDVVARAVPDVPTVTVQDPVRPAAKAPEPAGHIVHVGLESELASAIVREKALSPGHLLYTGSGATLRVTDVDGSLVFCRVAAGVPELDEPVFTEPLDPPDSIGSITYVASNGGLVMIELEAGQRVLEGELVGIGFLDAGILVEAVEVDERTVVARLRDSGERPELRVGQKVTRWAPHAPLLGAGRTGTPVGRVLPVELEIEALVLMPRVGELVALVADDAVLATGRVAQHEGQVLGVELSHFEPVPRGRRVAVRAMSRRPLPSFPVEGTPGPAFPVPPAGDLTWVADYSENRLLAFDAAGVQVRSIEDIYGAWDVEPLPNGNLLVTEFALNRITELDVDRRVVWQYEGLRNPYDADRLPNGNTLIADTFAERVIEVDRAGAVVWEYDDPRMKPYDVERLANGNTLIADGGRSRVIEVDATGAIVWRMDGLENVHDADRLPNGNTLITLRNEHRVFEVAPDGRVVLAISGLASPTDADRLPDGSTLVAENGQVRVFAADGEVTWKVTVSWAVEANRR